MEDNTYPEEVMSFKKFSFSGTGLNQLLNPQDFQQYQIVPPFISHSRDNGAVSQSNFVPFKESTIPQGSGYFQQFSSNIYNPSFSSNFAVPDLTTSQVNYDIPFGAPQLPVYEANTALAEQQTSQDSDSKFPIIPSSKLSSIEFMEPFKDNRTALCSNQSSRLNSSGTHMMLKYKSSFSQTPNDSHYTQQPPQSQLQVQLPQEQQQQQFQHHTLPSVTQPFFSQHTPIINGQVPLLDINHADISVSNNKSSVDYTSPSIDFSLKYPEVELKSHSATPSDTLPPYIQPKLESQIPPQPPIQNQYQLNKIVNPMQTLPILSSMSITPKGLLSKPVRKRRNKGDPPLEYTCPCCPKVYDKLNNLKSHMASHSTARPFVCKYCDRGFARNYDCKRHQRLHEKNKV